MLRVLRVLNVGSFLGSFLILALLPFSALVFALLVLYLWSSGHGFGGLAGQGVCMVVCVVACLFAVGRYKRWQTVAPSSPLRFPALFWPCLPLLALTLVSPFFLLHTNYLVPKIVSTLTLLAAFALSGWLALDWDRALKSQPTDTTQAPEAMGEIQDSNPPIPPFIKGGLGRIPLFIKGGLGGIQVTGWEKALLILVVCYWVTFTAMAWRRHAVFYSTHDLAALDQAYWWTLHGRFFWNSFDRISHLRVHFSPILLFHLPFYALFPSALTLLAIQSLFLSAAALPLYAIGRALGLSRPLSFALAFAYLFHPGTAAIHFNDFYAEGHAPLFVFLAAYFWVRSRWWAFFAALFLMLMVKQSLMLIALMFGVVSLLYPHAHKGVCYGYRRQWQWVVIPFLLVAFYFVLCYYLLRPKLNPWSVYYGDLASSPGELVHSLFTHPSRCWERINEPKKWFYLYALYTPVLAAVPWLSWFALLPLPLMLLYLLSTWWTVASVWYHYATPVVAAVFVATAHGLSRLANWLAGSLTLPRVRQEAGALAEPLVRQELHPLTASMERQHPCRAPTERSLALMLIFLCLPPSATWFDPGKFHHPHHKALREAVSLIPPDVTVQSQSQIIPHLSHRPDWWMGTNPTAVYVIVNTNVSDFPLEREREDARQLARALEEARRLGKYQLIWESEGVRVYRRVTNPKCYF